MNTAGTRVGGQDERGSCGLLLDLGFFFRFFLLGQELVVQILGQIST